MEEDNYITLFIVEDGEEHLVADVLRVVFDCDFGCGADGREERGERREASNLEVVREEGVVGGILGGAGDDNDGRFGWGHVQEGSCGKLVLWIQRLLCEEGRSDERFESLDGAV